MAAEAALNADALRELAIQRLMIECNFLDWLPVSAGYVYLAASVLLCLLRPKVGFVFIVFSLFFRFQDRLPEFSQFPGFLMQLAALAVGIGVAHQQLDLRLARVDKWLLGFAAVSSMGVLLRHTDQLIAETSVYMSSLVIFFGCRWLITTKAELQRVMLVTALAIGCLGFEAFYAVNLQQDPHPFWLQGSADGKPRLQSIGYFDNPNNFGYVLNVGLALWVALFFYTKRIGLKALYLLMMVLHVYVVTLTLSRSQLLTTAIIAALAWALLSKGKLLKKGVGLAAGFALMFLMLSYIPGPVKDRLDTMKSGPDESMEGRFSSWDEGIRMLGDFPVFGWGRGQWLSYHSLAAHNGYVQTMAETGLTGVCLFLGFLWAVLQPLGRLNQLPLAMRQDKKLFMGPIMALACLLFYWMVGNVTYASITYLLLGLVTVVGRFLMAAETDTAAQAAIPVKKKFRSQFLDRDLN
jgi:hypothetical protein